MASETAFSTALDKFRASRAGWLFSLRDDRDRGSDWGSAPLFLCAVRDSAVRSGEDLLFSAQVHGKTFNSDCILQPGDGIAFYHSKRAIFSHPLFHPKDEHGGRQRITLMGTIQTVVQHERDVVFLEVLIPADHFYSDFVQDSDQIVWTEDFEDEFVSCGLRSNVVATFYPVPPATWRRFRDKADESIREYTGE